jgi:hypothetical protein
MQKNPEQLELLINRALDAQISEADELELNRSLIRDPEMMRLRDDYHKMDVLATHALGSIRGGASVDLEAVFAAAPVKISSRRMAPHRGWLMIPGAIAAALLAMVIPDPNGPTTTQTPMVVDQGSLFSVPGTNSWGENGLARPVSTVPRVQRQTGTDVIGVVGDDGNLYWIEVERKKTVRWPGATTLPADPNDSM